MRSFVIVMRIGSEIIAMPADEYQVTTMVDFGTKVLGYSECLDRTLI